MSEPSWVERIIAMLIVVGFLCLAGVVVGLLLELSVISGLMPRTTVRCECGEAQP